MLRVQNQAKQLHGSGPPRRMSALPRVCRFTGVRTPLKGFYSRSGPQGLNLWGLSPLPEFSFLPERATRVGLVRPESDCCRSELGTTGVGFPPKRAWCDRS